MKRLVCLFAVMSIVLGASLAAGAVSIDGDVSYLFGLGNQRLPDSLGMPWLRLCPKYWLMDPFRCHS